MSKPRAIEVIDRRSGLRVQETVLGGTLVRLSYCSPFSPLARLLLFRNGLVSRLLGWYADSALSRRRIAPTIRQLGIDMADFVVPPGGFRSFNDFFIRALKPGARPFDPAPDTIASPADCRLLVHEKLRHDTCFPVKGVPFTVNALLGQAPSGTEWAARFQGGTLMVARLCPADYHRFHFPCSGRVAESWPIRGRYESVNPLPLACGAEPFARNKREVTILKSDAAGTVAIVEVGAFGVGRIRQTYAGPQAAKMDEKGWFEFGGSTVVLVFEPDRFTPADDLAANSRNGDETLVRAGDTIGRARPNSLQPSARF
jgi:phosphatidylserine decarboxylase